MVIFKLIIVFKIMLFCAYTFNQILVTLMIVSQYLCFDPNDEKIASTQAENNVSMLALSI